MDFDHDIMTIEELADYLRMQKVTIYKHVQEGKIPAFKVGGAWRFKRSTIDKWIEEQEHKK
ncbi:MAG: helix-turn-helix domain-containing protein [Candidatus Omnitrophica bacterium]|jgi:excisionase family DNA binding protein|nr:helix-turn-helix domain-containing protein [Candidatus Omnitrophota bacterium]